MEFALYSFSYSNIIFFLLHENFDFTCKFLTIQNLNKYRYIKCGYAPIQLKWYWNIFYFCIFPTAQRVLNCFSLNETKRKRWKKYKERERESKEEDEKMRKSININRNDDSLCSSCCSLWLPWDSEWYRLCKKFNSCTRLKEIKRHDDNLYQEILINCVFFESILKKRKWYDIFRIFRIFFLLSFVNFVREKMLQQQYITQYTHKFNLIYISGILVYIIRYSSWSLSFGE